MLHVVASRRRLEGLHWKAATQGKPRTGALIAPVATMLTAVRSALNWCTASKATRRR